MSAPRFERNPDVVSRRIRGEHILVPIARHSGALDSLFTLNETAGLVWERAGSGMDLGAIAETFSTEFGIPREQAEADVRRAIGELVAIGALKPAAETA